MTTGSRLSRPRSSDDERLRQTVRGRARRRYLRRRYPRTAQHRRPRRYSCRLARQPGASLPGRPMSDEQHMAFTCQFGELEFNPAALIAKQYGVETQTAGRKREIPPEISVISNIVEDGKAIGGLGDGEAFWHTDSSFVDVPPAASLLR